MVSAKEHSEEDILRFIPKKHREFAQRREKQSYEYLTLR
jgi:hypothetical protein